MKHHHDTLVIVLPDRLPQRQKRKLLDDLRREVPNIGIYPDTIRKDEAIDRAEIAYMITSKIKGCTP